MAQKYSYVGSRTAVTLPPQKEGDEAETLTFVPGGVYGFSKHQLEQPIISRYLRLGALTPYEEPAKPTASTRKQTAEGK
jgi:hypothetical protein